MKYTKANQTQGSKKNVQGKTNKTEARHNLVHTMNRQWYTLQARTVHIGVQEQIKQVIMQANISDTASTMKWL